MNLEVNKWKPFRVDSIFDIYTGGDLIMGDVEPGDIPIASNSAENNNIATYCGVIPDRKLFDHTKSISIADRGKFWAFIQPKDFYLATRVKGLVCKDYNTLNEWQMAFVVSVLNQESFKFSYGRNCCANLPGIMLYLPIKHNQNGTPFIDKSCKYSKDGFTPDWQFMEDYIKSLHHKPLTTKNKLNKRIELNIENWKEFRLGDLFDVELSKGDIKADEIDEGNTILISSGETDNGVVKYIDSEGDGKAKIFDGNKLTIDMFGNAYYQADPFYAVSHGRVNILTAKFSLNKFIGLFIVTLIQKERFKYSYGRAVYSNVVMDMIIKLPVTEENIPDWQFMENYIKNLPYGDRLNK